VNTLDIHSAEHKQDITHIRSLFAEYASSLAFSLDFQGFAEELDTLPGVYASPEGCLLLATVNDEPAGCIALRKLEDGVCEMKRLYVRPEYRGQKFSGRSIGVSLVVKLLQIAQRLGYKKMRLDTVPSMTRAIALYKALGFREIEPYCYNPFPDALFFELDLVQPE
jgi:ribosomal protein S18 acetylase RimI-like enzyme